MPYESDADVPKHVPSNKRSQWRQVWNSAYKSCQSKGSKDCEASAFRRANGVALSEKLAALFSDIPAGTPKIPSSLAVYLELTDAKKDSQCLTVEVSGGVSAGRGCCNLWEKGEGTNPSRFACGTCLYLERLNPGNQMSVKGKLGSPRLFTTNLVTLGELIDQTKGLYKIPIAYTGTFHKDGDKFSITDADLFSIVKNFKKKGNGEVNLDYEHASEMPDIAKGGPVPSAGGITNLTIEPGDDGKPWLFGTVGYTELARQLVESRQYRYFSPAIDWGAEDKSTGEPQGATLTSAALTNRPFLEKLPPLLMTEVPRILTEETNMSVTSTDPKKLRLRKIMRDDKPFYQIHEVGTGEGEAAFGVLLGEIIPGDPAVLAEGASSKGETTSKGEPSSKGEPHMDKVMKKMGEELGEISPVSMTDVKKFYVAGKEHTRMQDANAGHKLLSETVTPQGWDKRKSRALLSEGKVSPQQYAAFENAIELVEQGVEEGKIHPTQRAYFLTDAINRPAEFEKMLKEAKPYIELTEKGLSGVSTDGRTNLSEADSLKQEVTAYMKEHKCKYTVALKAVNSGNPERAQRLREENSKRARMM